MFGEWVNSFEGRSGPNDSQKLVFIYDLKQLKKKELR